ncbi:MAG: hypothetical protein VYA30_01540 [Myxococcota bacterium]|nr:hypothetical protein [Myxococcota bacterium]
MKGPVLLWGYILCFCLTVLACEPAPSVSLNSITVTAPKAGRVLINGIEQFVSPSEPTTFEGSFGEKFDITFVSDTDRLTLLDVRTPSVSFESFMTTDDFVRARRTQVFFRLEPEEHADMVVVSDGEIFYPNRIDDSSTLSIDVPAGVPLTALALWRGPDEFGWTIRQLDLPETLTGREIVLQPDVEPAQELLTQTLNSPVGWMTTELVYRGIRTGLMVGEGHVSPRQGVAVPSLGQDDDDLSFWTHIVARSTASNQPIAAAGLSIEFGRSSLGLEWPAPPQVSPVARTELDATPLPAQGTTFEFDSQPQTDGYYDIHLTALGSCQSLDWRLITPIRNGVSLPEIYGDRIFEAPLIRGRIERVETAGLSLREMISSQTEPMTYPQKMGQVIGRAVQGHWRRDEACEVDALFGRFAIYRADESQCPIAGVSDTYMIGRCGDLIRTGVGSVDQPEHCGAFSATEFVSYVGQALPVVELAPFGYTVGAGVTGFLVVPIEPPSMTADSQLVGEWFEYEITEQDFIEGPDAVDSPQNDPVRIAVGRRKGGPWLTVDASGRARSVGHLARFDLSLRTDGEKEFFEVDAPGCRRYPRQLVRSPADDDVLLLTERIPYEVPGEYRQRIYTFRR